MDGDNNIRFTTRQSTGEPGAGECWPTCCRNEDGGAIVLPNQNLSSGFFRAVGSAAMVVTLCVTQPAQAQNRRNSYDPYQKLAQIESGTYITIRTRQSIDTNRSDGRVFTAVVDQDVWDDYRRLAIPAIPRGSPVELLVRTARDGDLILDLDSVIVGGQRYAVSARADRIDAGGRADNNGDHAAEFIGGGAIIGSIVGAIAGGGKGAAIGAAAGAAAGTAGLLTRGRFVRVPAGSLLTFRLDRDLKIGVPDDGFRRDQWHYHR